MTTRCAPRDALAILHQSLIGEAVEHSSMLAFVADEDMKYVAINSRACEVLGYSREELLKLRVVDVASQSMRLVRPWHAASAEDQLHNTVLWDTASPTSSISSGTIAASPVVQTWYKCTRTLSRRESEKPRFRGLSYSGGRI